MLLLLVTALPFIACQDFPGGQQPYKADLSDAYVVFAVQGINDFFKTNGDTTSRVAERLVSATIQIVSGTLYRFQLVVSGGDETEVCSVSVWSQPWLTGHDALKLDGTPVCAAEESGAGRQLGGEEVVTLKDATALAALIALEKRFTAQLNSDVYLVGVTFDKITKQVVNGVLFRFYDVIFAKSTCPPTEILAQNYDACVFSAIGSQQVQKCNAEVYWSPVAISVTSEECTDIS